LYIIHLFDAQHYNTPLEFVCHHQKKFSFLFIAANITVNPLQTNFYFGAGGGYGTLDAGYLMLNIGNWIRVSFIQHPVIIQRNSILNASTTAHQNRSSIQHLSTSLPYPYNYVV